MRCFDERIGEWCQARGITYTRYCDDMTFSGHFNARQVKNKVCGLLAELGLSLNQRKSCLVAACKRQQVTGIVVNHKPQLAREARRASELAAQHFPTFNLDLMYGLPGQTFAEALDDVAQALAFAPPHLSCYQLTLEPNTPFAAFPPEVPDSDSCADMQDAIEARLATAGYSNYETSAFAQPGRHCQHNLNYWQFGDYLGIGAGAHSKLTLHDRVLRQMRYKHPAAYLEHAAAGRAVQEERAVPPEELAGEFMMNALRLHAGFPPDLFALRTSLPLQALLPLLKEAERDGLLELSAHTIRPSLRGRRFLNLLIERFL